MLEDFLDQYAAHRERAAEQGFKPLTRQQFMSLAVGFDAEDRELAA